MFIWQSHISQTDWRIWCLCVIYWPIQSISFDCSWWWWSASGQSGHILHNSEFHHSCLCCRKIIHIPLYSMAIRFIQHDSMGRRRNGIELFFRRTDWFECIRCCHWLTAIFFLSFRNGRRWRRYLRVNMDWQVMAGNYKSKNRSGLKIWTNKIFVMRDF